MTRRPWLVRQQLVVRFAFQFHEARFLQKNKTTNNVLYRQSAVSPRVFKTFSKNLHWKKTAPRRRRKPRLAFALQSEKTMTVKPPPFC